MSLVLETDAPDAVSVGKNGEVKIEQPDGSVVIDFAPQPKKADDNGKWFANLAERLDDGKLGMIAEELLTAIAADEQTRSDDMATRARIIELLGLKVEAPRTDIGSSSAPLEGMSSVRHPILLEACLRFQANARGELLPSSGPAKIDNQGRATAQRDELAEHYEQEFNNYLTTTATEYYPDTDRMLFSVGAQGAEFKKVYHCPLRNRPVSEWVRGEDLIVNNSATDLRNAERVTHQLMMRTSMVKRLQRTGAYRDIELSQPNQTTTVVQDAKAATSGVSALPQRPEDQQHTIYETYCELELDQFQPRGFKGITLPFAVTIDRDSRQVLAVRRNWAKDDDACLPLTPFVEYPYVRGMGFYGFGLGRILANSASALTAGWREGIDAGMFANFPGFLYSEAVGRQLTTNFRVPPGGGMRIQTSGPINQAVMPLPYKSMEGAFVQFLQWVEGTSQRVGGTAEVGVGEGKQNAPVGTTLSLIEQATMVVGAVLKSLHQAQSEEFQKLIALFREDPEAMWRSTPQRKRARPWNEAEMMKAIEDTSLVPKADPNAAGHMVRMMRASTLLQMADTNPQDINRRQAYQHALTMMRFDPESVMNPPSAGVPQKSDAQVIAEAELAKAQIKAATDEKNTQVKAAQALAQSQEKQADREFREREADDKRQIEVIKLATSLAVHPESLPVVEQILPNGVAQ